MARLAELQRKEETIQKSICNLRAGIEQMRERVLQARPAPPAISGRLPTPPRDPRRLCALSP